MTQDLSVLLSLAERDRRATWDRYAPLPTDCGYVMRLRCVECGIHAYQMTQDETLAGTEQAVRCAACRSNHDDHMRGAN